MAATTMIAVMPLLFVIQAPADFWLEGTWPFIGSLAIFLFFTGVAFISAVNTLRKFDNEYRHAQRIYAAVQSDLRKLDNEKHDLRPGDTEPSHYIPADANGSACAKLVVKHYNTARALRSDDGIAAQVVEAELTSGRTSLRPLAGFALRIGILLTFIGLLRGLAPIGAALNSGDLAEIPVGKLLSGLTVSFSSSIAGLAAALVIGMMALTTEHGFKRLRTMIDDLALALRQLYSRVRFGGDLSKTVDHLTVEMRNHAREMESHGVQVERSVNEASRAFREHADESATIMRSIAQSNEDLVALEREHRAQIE
ncbi:MAG: hypothetical protein AAGG44_13720, partial [Planctomycetota bacterium]